MMEDIPIVEPHDQIYNKEIIRELLQDVPTDYYQRFEFNDAQQYIHLVQQ
jgi:hypothetical protein